ncbi:hypothetical protein ACIBEJ_04930 [Nonomuraea sp. NPDC050790]|uniref:protein kinase domain-containing protein n=1 Tax=Nonomuraea sp. NPDC050790 TaxID=3364371 RepID=UPI0037B463EA
MHPIRPDDPKKLGDYVLLERLPDGPRGATFLGQESEDAPVRVIKLLTGHGDAARFAGARRVTGSSVARTVDADLHEGAVYVVREHVEGRSLAVVLSADGPLDADALDRLATATLTALTATHLAGLTHGGLTPGNVIMGVDGIRVTDPDLGEPAGAAGYRAPEQRRGEPYGSAADLYAWAATVVFAATGSPPSGDEAEPSGVPALAEPLRSVVTGALSREPERRPSAHSALIRLLGGPPADPDKTTDPGQPEVTADRPPGPEITAKLPSGRPDPTASLPAGMAEQPPGQPHLTAGVPPLDSSLPTFPAPPMPGAAPLEGVPVPQQPPPAQQHWGPPQQPWEPQQPRVWQASVVGAPSPRRKVPVGLVASVAALMVLSGAGLWGASRYTDAQRIDSVGVSADGEATDNPGGSIVPGENGVESPGDGGVPQQGEPGPAQSEVPVPWATSTATDPDAVGPLILPTEEPSGVPTAPAYSAVPTPTLPTQQVPTPQPTTAQPTTAQPTAAQPTTGKPAAQPTTPKPATAKPTTAKPTPVRPTSAQPTTEQPKPTPSKSPQPEATPSKSPSATPTPTADKTTKAPEPTPTPTKSSVAPAPSTPTQAPPPPATKAPAPVQQPVQSPPPPQPEPKNPHTPVQVCGSGFYVQRSQAFNGGETFQLYNTATKQNCVVTMKYAGVGKESPVSATLDVQGGPSATDSGNFKYYAGPVKLLAPGKCVKFSGSVGAASTAAGWANCG